MLFRRYTYPQLPVHPVFDEQKTNGSDKKLVKRKQSHKKDHRTNIIATNFV